MLRFKFLTKVEYTYVNSGKSKIYMLISIVRMWGIEPQHPAFSNLGEWEKVVKALERHSQDT